MEAVTVALSLTCLGLSRSKLLNQIKIQQVTATEDLLKVKVLECNLVAIQIKIQGCLMMSNIKDKIFFKLNQAKSKMLLNRLEIFSSFSLRGKNHLHL